MTTYFNVCQGLIKGGSYRRGCWPVNRGIALFQNRILLIDSQQPEQVVLIGLPNVDAIRTLQLLTSPQDRQATDWQEFQ